MPRRQAGRAERATGLRLLLVLSFWLAMAACTNPAPIPLRSPPAAGTTAGALDLDSSDPADPDWACPLAERADAGDDENGCPDATAAGRHQPARRGKRK